MIPLRDDNRSDSLPFVTIGIIMLNLVIYLYQLSLGPQFGEAILLFGVVPHKIMNLKSPIVLVTLFTSLFFHADFLHLLGNMLYLWVFGNNIEDRLGHLRFAYFYLICGALTGLAYSMIIPNSEIPLIGASGAISAVLGAYFLLNPLAKISVLLPIFIFWRVVKIPAFWFLLIYVLWQFLVGTVFESPADMADRGGVAWFAHVLGFIFGALFLGVFLKKEKDF